MPVSIDQDVTGRMTFVTNVRIPVSQVPARLNAALQPLGYGISAISGGGVRVGRVSSLQASAAAAANGPRLIALRFVQASEVVAAIQPSLPDGVRAAADPANTGVIISGPAPGADTAEQLVRLFDVDKLRGRSFIVYPLSNASANSVVREFSTIYGGDSQITIEPVNRLNAVLVVTNQAALMPRVRQTLAQLDTSQGGAIGMRIFPIHHRRAADVAVLLARIFGAPAPAVSGQGSPAGDFGRLSVGSGGMGGSKGGGSSGITALPPGIGDNSGSNILMGGQSQGNVQTERQFAEDLGLSAPVRVQVDTATNGVVILAAPADMGLIAQTIRQLDVRPKQVFIEATVAEVQLNNQLQFGLSYAFRAGNSSVSQLFPSGQGFSDNQPIAGGFSWMVQTPNARVMLQALSGITTVHVVSAPRMMVTDNQVATLQVGDQVPILIQQSQAQDTSSAPIVNSIEMRDTGVILAVRPRVGASGAISLDIFQEVSTATQTTVSGINSPTIRMRRFQSTVDAHSGQTIAMGGLMQDNVTRNNTGVPILNQIPFIGALFGATNDTATRTELLVMLSPRIVDDDSADGQEVTDELSARISALAPDVGKMITPGRGSIASPPTGFLRLPR